MDDVLELEQDGLPAADAAGSAGAGAPAVDKDGPGTELNALRAQLAERDAMLAEHERRQREMVERFRQALAEGDPILTAADIPGDSFEAVERNYRAARDLVARAREMVPGTGPVPAGAPPRSRPAPVTPFEKIRDGLSVRDRAG